MYKGYCIILCNILHSPVRLIKSVSERLRFSNELRLAFPRSELFLNQSLHVTSPFISIGSLTFFVFCVRSYTIVSENFFSCLNFEMSS